MAKQKARTTSSRNRALGKHLNDMGFFVAEMHDPRPQKQKDVLCLIVSVSKPPAGFLDWLNESL